MIAEWDKEINETVQSILLNVLCPNNSVAKVKSVALIIAVDSPRNFAEKLINKAKLAPKITK